MRFVPILMAALICAVPVLPAHAERRAILIGNADYAEAPDLAGSDTPALAEALREASFHTAAGIDLGASDLRDLLGFLTHPEKILGARIIVLNGRFLNDGGETWFMGTDAHEPDRLSAGVQGVPLSLVMRLASGGQPGAILLLGTDGQQMQQGGGLRNGIGALTVPEDMAIITGPPEATALALAKLIQGSSAAQAVTGNPALRLLPGSAERLVVVPRDTGAQPADPLGDDRAAWAQAARDNSEAGYIEYLSHFPRGVFSAAAQERLARIQRESGADADDKAWAAAEAAGDPPAYSAYLRRFPSGRHAVQARARIESDALAKGRPPAPRPAVPRTPPEVRAEVAIGLNNAQRADIQRHLSRLGYDSGTADGLFGQRTRAAIAAWQAANDHPGTGYLTAAQSQQIGRQVAYLDGDNGSRDQAYWRKTGAPGDPQGLRAYLRRYPGGIHAAQARRMLEGRPANGEKDSLPLDDDATWAWARRQGSAAAYETYLERYPRGRNAAKARMGLQTLRAGTEAARREEAALRLDSATRLLIEERLRSAGMRPGAVDGEFNSETRAALRRYQAARNLRVTGYVTQETVGQLLRDVLIRERS